MVKKRVELSQEQAEEYNKRIMRVMLGIVSKIPAADDNFTLRKEIDILADALSAGYKEKRAIQKELYKEHGKDEAPWILFDLEPALASCVLAKVLYMDEMTEDTDISMHTHGGYRILRLAAALRVFEAASVIGQIDDNEESFYSSPDTYLELKK